MVDAREGSFEFVGFTFSRRRNPKTAKMITLVEPSRKSQNSTFAMKCEGLTARWTHCVSQQDVVERVNRYVWGWVNYFHVHNSTRVFTGSAFS